MKHIKRRIEFLKEAFESETISSAVKWLDKIKKDESKQALLSDLRGLSNEFDFPIDKISDKFVKFVKKKKAVELRCQQEVYNPKGIYCLKYWFSNDSGYLGYTGTPERNLEKNLYEDDNRFSESEIKTISETVKDPETGNFVTTGIITPLADEDYKSLATGQKVILYLDNVYDKVICFATIVAEGDNIFAIQNSMGGGTPRHMHPSEWSKWGRYSWMIMEDGIVLDDHSKLNIYEKGENPLSEKKKDAADVDPRTWNLKLRKDFYTYPSKTGGTVKSADMMNSADFAIVVFLDELLGSDFIEKSETEKERAAAKTGVIATKGTPFGLKHEEIKNINIERRAAELISRMGIKAEDSPDFKNLQKIAAKIYCERYSYIRLIRQGPNYLISELIQNLSNLLSSSLMSEKDNNYRVFFDEYYKKTTSLYNRISKECADVKMQYQNCENDLLANFKGTDKIELIKKIKEINNLLYDRINSFPIDTIEDLTIFQIKLSSLYEGTSRAGFTITAGLKNIILSYNDHMRCNYDLKLYNAADLDKDILALNNIKRLIQSLFR